MDSQNCIMALLSFLTTMKQVAWIIPLLLLLRGFRTCLRNPDEVKSNFDKYVLVSLGRGCRAREISEEERESGGRRFCPIPFPWVICGIFFLMFFLLYGVSSALDPPGGSGNGFESGGGGRAGPSVVRSLAWISISYLSVTISFYL